MCLSAYVCVCVCVCVCVSVQDGIKPTVLYSTNKDVDSINNSELARLPGDSVLFKCRDTVRDTSSNTNHTHIMCLSAARSYLVCPELRKLQ